MAKNYSLFASTSGLATGYDGTQQQSSQQIQQPPGISTEEHKIVLHISNIQRNPFIFSQKVPTDDLLQHAYMYANIRARTKPAIWEPLPVVYTLAEALSYCKTHVQRLSRTESENAFIKTVYSILPLKNSIPNVTDQNLMETYRSMEINVHDRSDLPIHARDSFVKINTYHGALVLLHIWGNSRIPQPFHVAFKMKLYLLTSIATMGCVTPEHLVNIRVCVFNEMKLSVDLHKNVVEAVWQFLEKFVDETNADDIVVPWLGTIPANAYNLREMFYLKPYMGFPKALLIKDALLKHPNFNWSWVETEFPEETRALIALFNEHYLISFAKKRLQLSDDAYCHLHYVAVNLLVDGNVNSFPSVGKLKTIDEMIETYKKNNPISSNSISVVCGEQSKLVEMVSRM